MSRYLHFKSSRYIQVAVVTIQVILGILTILLFVIEEHCTFH